VAIAPRDIAVIRVDEAHATIIRVVCTIPACAVMEGNLRNRIMFRMEWKHGINTPVSVPCFCGSFLRVDNEDCCWVDSFLAGEDKKWKTSLASSSDISLFLRRKGMDILFCSRETMKMKTCEDHRPYDMLCYAMI